MKSLFSYPISKCCLFIVLFCACFKPATTQTLTGGVISSDTLYVPLDSNLNNGEPCTRRFTIYASAATGGNGSYSYQWLWGPPPGVAPLQIPTSNLRQNFDTVCIPPGLILYLQRKVTSAGVTAYTNIVYVLAYTTIQPGIISPAISYIDPVIWPSQLQGTAPSGGAGASTFTFQWQSSADGITWSNISGATTSWYQPPLSPVPAYYRRGAISQGVTVYSNVAEVILPLGNGGLIGVSPATVSPGGNAVLNSLTIPTTGTCMGNYIYTWQSSIDEISWTNLPGPNVTPAQNSFYRRKAICGTDSVYSNTISVKVKNTGIDIPTGAMAPVSGTQTALTMPQYFKAAPSNINYVLTRAFIQPGITSLTAASSVSSNLSVQQSTAYFDGLGRKIQTVNRQATPNNNDLINTTFYDNFGRISQQYLPYSDTGTTGNFRPDAPTQQPAFYNNYFGNTEGFYYANTINEASPVNKVLRITSPGNSWTGSNIGITTMDRGNSVYDSVKIWWISLTADTLPYSNAYYTPSALFVSETSDENGNKMISYKDIEGHVILKKVQVSDALNVGYTGWLCTYYIYDDIGNLRFVLPPKATDWLRANNWIFDAATWKSSVVVQQLCFSYEYDARQRIISKHIPGAGEAWLVYDVRDRLVMTQDSVLRSQGNWLYTQYDSLDRSILTGVWTTTGDRNYQQSQAGTTINYPAPVSNYTILTQTYYDKYDSIISGGSGLSSSLINTYTGNTSYFYTPSNAAFPYPQPISASNMTNGMVTGTKVNVLGTSTYLYAANFYDDRGRLIQTQNTNYTGGKDTLTLQYGFPGMALRTLEGHGKGGTNPQTYQVLTKTNYDAAGRIIQVNQKTGNSPEVILTANQYDELSQLKQKNIGQTRVTLNQNTYTATPLDSLKYTYNIRGWLKGINKDYANAVSGAVNWFGMELNYDYGFNQTQLNGNIAGTKWRNNSDGMQRAYGFSYDANNRLTRGDFTQNAGGNTWNTNANIDFSVRNLTYDLNGNIMTMSQIGVKLNTPRIIDSLIYGYNSNSNQLNYVTDLQNDTSAHLGDFTEINNNTTQDYSYDGNGNLTLDNNKGISTISYNILNLPKQITFTQKGNVSYVYDASGRKLQKITTDNIVSPAKTTTTTYVGGFVYQNDTLQFLSQEEGRVRPKTPGRTDSMYYDYFEKDQLGDTRIVLTDEQKQDTYPVATLENNSASMAVEQSYYNINLADTIGTGRIPGFTGNAADIYYNNNGNPPYNTNPNANTTAQNAIMYRLNGSTGDKTGLGITLRVMSGDVVDIYGKSIYHLNTGQTPANNYLIANVLNSFIAAFAGTPAIAGASKGATAAALEASPTTPSGLLNWMDTIASPISTVPRADINWILFDDQFNPVASNCGYDGVSAVADVLKSHHRSVTVSKTGYLYVYCSNESNIDVFFDNLQVIHTRGPLLETTNYYPFGLTMAGISSKALKTNYTENKFRFNKGSELQNKEFSDGSGLEWYDAEARGYDPQVGRFMQIDPKPDVDGQESLTPYQFGTDDPVRYNDPSGKCPTCILGFFIGVAVDVGAQMLKNKLEGKPLSDINFKEAAVAGAAGFITSGVSAIYADAAVTGTELAMSKAGASAIVAGVTSVLNQANDAVDKGEPINISPIKIVTDIVTDKFADHISEKIPEFKINGKEAPKLNNVAKTTAGDVTSKAVDLATEGAKKPPAKLAPIKLVTPTITNLPDKATNKMHIPKLRKS